MQSTRIWFFEQSSLDVQKSCLLGLLDLYEIPMKYLEIPMKINNGR